MSTLKGIKTFCAAGALALALVGAAHAQQTVKIGAVLSITGPASFLGEPEDKTIRMSIEKINAQGGVAGRKIDLVVYDDGGDANKARTFATRLIDDDKVAVMIGGTTTGTTMAMLPVFEDAQVPFVSLAGAIEIIDPVRKYVFKTPHTDKMACEKIFEDLKERNLTKIAMVSGTDGFGASMHALCVKVAPIYGIQILTEESYGPRDSDMTAQLTKIKGTAGVQAIVNAGFGQGPAIVTRNYAQLGMTSTPLYQSHGVASKGFIDLAGPAADGVRLPGTALLVADKLPDSDVQKKVVLEYKKTYEDATKQPVSTFGGYMYDGLFIVVDAMKRANATDPKKIRDEIEKTKGFVGTAGVFTMSPTDHLGLDLSAFRMVEIKGGDWQLTKPGH